MIGLPMTRIINKYYPLFIILMVVVLLVSLFLWPATARILSWIVIVLGPGSAIALTIQSHVQSYRAGLIGHATRRNIVVDVLGILFTVTLALLTAMKTSAWVGPLAGNAAEKTWPGKGMIAALLAGILAAILVGSLAGILVRWIWGSLTKPRRPAPGEK